MILGLVGKVLSSILGMPDKRYFTFTMRIDFFYKFEHGYIINNDIWYSGMILSLGARCLEFNSTECTTTKLRQQVCDF